MGGPSASMFLQVPLTERQVDDLEIWLRASTSDLHGTRLDWHPFWIRDGTPLGMTVDPSVEPCWFAGWRPRPRWSIWRCGKKSTSPNSSAIFPQQELGFFAGCNRPLDHRILGHLALFLAERYGGLINMSGAITPPFKPDRQYSIRQYPRHTLEEIHEFVQGLPGKVIEVLYGEEVGKPWVYHIVDATFAGLAPTSAFSSDEIKR